MGVAWRAWIPAAVALATVAALLWPRSGAPPASEPPAAADVGAPVAVEPAPVPVAPSPSAAPGPALPEPAASDEPIPLERLLRWSDADEPRPRALRLEPGPDDPAGAAERPRRWYLEQRRDEHGPTTRPQTRRETEAGVSVPLDESVTVRGGVRVDSRQDAEAGSRKTETAPTVGVEVRF